MAKKKKTRKRRERRRKQRQLPKTFTTKKDHDARMSEIASHYQEVCDEIDNHIAAASELVSKLDPLRLEQRAYGEYAALTLNKNAEVELDEIDAIARRMIDYVQCLIVSTPPHLDGYVDFTEELWEELKQHVKAIFFQLVDYFNVASAKRSTEADFDETWEEFFTKAQMNWCFVKGDRHLNHLHAHLESLLQPHNDVFNELFGISATDFVEELEKVRIALTTGMFDAGLELKRLHQEFFDRLDQDEGSELQAGEDSGTFFRRKMAEYGYKAQFEEELGRFVGLNLFDLGEVTNLPVTLLDNLSWSSGEDTTFLSQEPFKGWPLSLWPTWNKPFLKANDNYYCFDMYALSDNIYRAIQKIIYRLKPEYKASWNNSQQAISEELPFQMFAKLLPGADFYKSVYYRWKTGQDRQLNWVECDGLVLYDDHLFIVEVKAGAFTYTPPATDAPAYIESIKSLLIKPAEQGQRFLNYLESAGSVKVYDENHNPIGEISRGSFRRVTICCVTIDQLTEFAAKSSHLQVIDGGLPSIDVWNISIDDLRVYADILQNPLQFLHFVEQRHEASKSSLILLEDELEHLGLYLTHNFYAQHAEELVASSPEQPDRVIWSGYSSEIDKYYSYLLSSNDAEPPQQKLPSIVIQILNLLSGTNISGRAKAASTLLNMSGETREQFVTFTTLALKMTKEKHRPQPFSLIGDTRVTVYCNPNSPSFSEKFDIAEHVLANIVIGKEQERLLLELFFDKQDNLVNVEFCFLTTQDIDKYGKEKIEALASTLSIQRVTQAIAQGEIRGNALCPCGSGKKYKRCHLRRKN